MFSMLTMTQVSLPQSAAKRFAAWRWRKAAIAAGIGPEIGWHTFRHLYRSGLDASGAAGADAPRQHHDHDK